LANKGRQSRTVLTINGKIKILRRWWYDPQAGSVAPVDEVIDPSGAKITPGVVEMASRENLSASSFRKAAAVLERTAQVKLSGEYLRQVVEAVGRCALQAQQSHAMDVAWHAQDCEVSEDCEASEDSALNVPETSMLEMPEASLLTMPAVPTPDAPLLSIPIAPAVSSPKKTRVYTGCDGVMVPIITDAEKVKRRNTILAKRRRSGKKCRPLPPRKQGADGPWKEFKVVYFYSGDMERQHTAFTEGNRTKAGTLMRREADRLRFREADERVGLVDGADWIRNQMHLNLPELDGLGLDFYHLGENVHRARRKVYGEKSLEGKAWAGTLMHEFKHTDYATVWQKLIEWRASIHAPTKRKAADRLLNYISSREEMICYPAFRARGWQIGSGPTESQCKLCTSRLKGRGRRWDRSNATAIAALDTLDRNGQWQKFWPNTCRVST